MTTVLPLAEDSVPQPAPLRAIWISAAILAVIYVALFLGGIRFFVFKTAVLPLLLAYAVLVRERATFIADWLPFLGATLLFDAIRGAIYILIQYGYHTYYLGYVIDLEQAVFGVPALTLPLQNAIRLPGFDLAAVMIHGSHFAFFLLFGLVLWHARREHFGYFRRSLVLVMALGLVGYAAIPTVPPWLAARPNFEMIPPILYITEIVYTHYVPEIYGAFSTNPVAAMPSLHAAFPAACAIVGWRAYGRRIGLALAAYATIVMFVVIYLGEHYAVDVVAGVAVAGIATAVASGTKSIGLSLRAAVMVGVLLVGLTTAIATLMPRIPLATF